MKARGIAAVLVAMVVLGALAQPMSSVAAIRPANRQTPRSVVEEFSLHGTHGFTVKISVRNRRRLGLTATAFHGLFSLDEAIYRLPVRRPHGSADINARIGKLGHIDVHFVPESIKEEAPPRSLRCHGGKITVEDGHFVGLIAFRGERGFTRVRAHRATGSITRSPALTCHIPPEKHSEAAGKSREAEEREAEGAQDVVLAATDRRKHITFVASRISGPSRHGKHLALTSFAAAATRRRGRIEEGAVAADLFDAGHYFRLQGPQAPISEAVLKPPPPFSGSATYVEGPGASQRWTGDLKVALPGFGDVPLTEHGMRVRTCEGLGCGLGFALTSSLAERLPLPRTR